MGFLRPMDTGFCSPKMQQNDARWPDGPMAPDGTLGSLPGAVASSPTVSHAHFRALWEESNWRPTQFPLDLRGSSNESETDADSAPATALPALPHPSGGEVGAGGGKQLVGDPRAMATAAVALQKRLMMRQVWMLQAVLPSRWH